MRRRYAVVLGVCVLGLVLFGVLVWPGDVLGGSSGAEAAGKRPSPSAASAPSATTAPGPAPGPAYGPGEPVPAAAVAVIQQLVSGGPAEQRAALTAHLARTLPDGTLFPSGSTVVLDRGGWHRAGDYANAQGAVTRPGAAPVRVEFGFMADSAHAGAWLVTFEELLS